ncbi:hypothetical protein [Natronincola ferrireducens]|uniref:Uncharacterized protein n=1 Tax=Natronincola ferrireducens TaxID=393762 RepID=A0A1G8ZMH4_9FIRM|nr:hypothetical protein [Natronincola ferrireducens]SDK16248.1 hypothetical protein SAMN05660472_00907 [Natronincola ferrireducens]
MKLDEIMVLLVFIGFCVGGYFLMKKADKEIRKQTSGNSPMNKDKQ